MAEPQNGQFLSACLKHHPKKDTPKKDTPQIWKEIRKSRVACRNSCRHVHLAVYGPFGKWGMRDSADSTFQPEHMLNVSCFMKKKDPGSCCSFRENSVANPNEQRLRAERPSEPLFHPRLSCCRFGLCGHRSTNTQTQTQTQSPPSTLDLDPHCPVIENREMCVRTCCSCIESSFPVPMRQAGRNF